MTWVELFLSVAKMSVVLGFLLNVAGLATWADRRQSAMVQHRIGPNRAVVYLPSFVVRGLLFVPGAILAVVPALIFGKAANAGAALERTMVAGQMTILVLWFHLALLSVFVRKRQPINALESFVGSVQPRKFFFVGVAAHILAFFAIRLAGSKFWFAASYPLGFVLGASLLAVAFYAASRVPDGKIGIRLLGTLHAAADAVKLIFKEDFVPTRADKLLHSLAPLIALFPALVTFAVIPYGNMLCFADNGNGEFEFADLSNMVAMLPRDGVCPGHAVPLQIIDLNVGILYVFAIGSTGVIGAAIAGWASDNKFSLLGGLRAASQMVSYEVAMGLSLVGVFIVFNAVRMQPMVEWQSLHTWGIFVQPIAFILFITALAAETKRVPFDQPEGESEIVAGYFLEYSGMKFGMFMTGEYAELITSSALLVTLFFGGYSMPFLYSDGIFISFGDTQVFEYQMNHLAVTILQVLAFFTKTVIVAWVQIFFRWTLPRFRYDQLMKLGWTKMLPLAIANLVVTAIVWLAIDSAPAAVTDALHLVADITKGIVVVAILAGIVSLIAGIMRPVERNRFINSTAARFAAAAGGTRPGPMQA